MHESFQPVQPETRILKKRNKADLALNSKVRSELEEKLEDYRDRFEEGPKASRRDAWHKMMLLERLLQHGNVDTKELAKELSSQYKEHFDPQLFQNAVEAIKSHNGIQQESSETQEQSHKLELNQSRRALGKLQQRLQQSLLLLCVYGHPDRDFQDTYTYYLWHIGTDLLKTGSVDADFLMDEYKEEYGSRFSEGKFWRAFKEIETMNRGELSN